MWLKKISPKKVLERIFKNWLKKSIKISNFRNVVKKFSFFSKHFLSSVSDCLKSIWKAKFKDAKRINEQNKYE
jgi:hypothetical protein